MTATTMLVATIAICVVALVVSIIAEVVVQVRRAQLGDPLDFEPADDLGAYRGCARTPNCIRGRHDDCESVQSCRCICHGNDEADQARDRRTLRGGF